MVGIVVTQNPISAELECYTKASWRLCAAIVVGLVVLSSFRIAKYGTDLTNGYVVIWKLFEGIPFPNPGCRRTQADLFAKPSGLLISSWYRYNYWLTSEKVLLKCLKNRIIRKYNACDLSHSAWGQHKNISWQVQNELYYSPLFLPCYGLLQEL